MAVFEVYAGDILIHHSQSPSPDVKLLNPKLTMEVSAAGSFTCKVPPTNIGYDKIDRLTTEITVKKDGEWLWSGRIISEEMDFWNNRTITCEGELAYLNDTTQPPAEYHNMTVRGFLQTLLSVHNLKNHLRSGYAYEIKFDRNSSMGNNYKFGAIWRLQDGKYAYFDYTANINGSKTIWVPCTSDFYFEVMRDKSSSSSSTIWGWKIESINIIQNEFIYDDTDFIDGIPYTGTENIEKYSVNNNLEGLESSHPYYSSMNQLWHINMVGNKDFMVGAVTVTDPNDSLYRYTNFESTLEDIKDKMIDRLGGYLRLRKENGIRWIDYLAEPLNTNSQVIEFGKNLLDFSKSWDLSDFATVVIPQGAMLDESPIEALDAYLDVSSVNNGSIYVFDQSIVDTYGWIEVVVSWSDVTTASRLLTKAQKYLSDIQFDTMILEVSAVDMSYMMNADSIEMIKLFDSVHCISKPHGMDKYFTVTKIEIPVDNPENTTFTLGDNTVKSSLSASIKTANQQIKNLIDSEPSTTSTMKKVLDEAKENAKQIMDQTVNGYITIETEETVEGIHSETLYISDNKDLSVSKKNGRYWKWNVQGLAYYKNGEDLGFAITMDGEIVADKITAGTLNANVIRAGSIIDTKGYNYWNLETGEFRLSAVNTEVSVPADYSGNNIPSYYNYPASSWSDSEKEANIGKTFYSSYNGKLYIWDKCIQYTKITFSSSSELETNWDYIYIYYYYNGSWWQSEKLTGSLANKVVALPVPTTHFRIYLYTDSSNAHYGFDITSVQQLVDKSLPSSVSFEKVSSLPSASYTYTYKTSYPSSTHPYSNSFTAYYIYEPDEEILIEDFPYNWYETSNSLSDYISNKAVSTINTELDQEMVFNKLTNNGQIQGIYLSNGNLYINASYIQTGQLSADLIKTGKIQDSSGNMSIDLSTGKISTNKLIIDASNFTLNENGDMTATGATLENMNVTGQLYVNGVAAVTTTSKDDIWIRTSDGGVVALRFNNGLFTNKQDHTYGGGWSGYLMESPKTYDEITIYNIEFHINGNYYPAGSDLKIYIPTDYNYRYVDQGSVRQ